MIELRKVSKSHVTPEGRRTVFRDLSFAFPEEKNIAILSHDRTERSILIKLLSGIEVPERGAVLTYGRRVSWPVNFSAAIQASLTATDMFKFLCRLHGVGRKDARERLSFVMDLAELGSYVDRPIKDYPKGMKPRLVFGLTMALDFDYYVIDEVLAAGDSVFREKCNQVLAEKLRSARVIVASRNLGLVRKLADCAVVLRDGLLFGFDDLEDGIRSWQAAAKESRLSGTGLIPPDSAEACSEVDGLAAEGATARGADRLPRSERAPTESRESVRRQRHAARLMERDGTAGRMAKAAGGAVVNPVRIVGRAESVMARGTDDEGGASGAGLHRDAVERVEAAASPMENAPKPARRRSSDRPESKRRAKVGTASAEQGTVPVERRQSQPQRRIACAKASHESTGNMPTTAPELAAKAVSPKAKTITAPAPRRRRGSVRGEDAAATASGSAPKRRKQTAVTVMPSAGVDASESGALLRRVERRSRRPRSRSEDPLVNTAVARVGAGQAAVPTASDSGAERMPPRARRREAHNAIDSVAEVGAGSMAESEDAATRRSDMTRRNRSSGAGRVAVRADAGRVIKPAVGSVMSEEEVALPSDGTRLQPQTKATARSAKRRGAMQPSKQAKDSKLATTRAEPDVMVLKNIAPAATTSAQSKLAAGAVGRPVRRGRLGAPVDPGPGNAGN